MILNKEILDDLRMKEIEQFNIQSSIMGVILNHQICFQCFYLLLFMGGSVNYQSNSPQHIHQRLGNVQLIKKPSTINPTGAITTIKKIIPVRNDKEFQVWQQSLNRVKNTETLDVIFFPDNYHFEGAGMCGSTGVITVPSTLLSFYSRITSLFWRARLEIERTTTNPFQKPRYGTCSTI